MGLLHKKTEEEKQERKKQKDARQEEIRDRLAARFPNLKMPEKPAPREQVDGVLFVERNADVMMRVSRVYKMGVNNKVVTGTVTKGTLYVGNELYVASEYDVVDKCVVTDIAQFSKHFGSAPQGAMVQVTLDAPNVTVMRGDVLFVMERKDEK